MEFKEKTVKVNYLYKGKILNLRKDDIILPDGRSAVREIVEHSGGSTVYCEKDGKVLLVKQFRYPYKEEIWELPAGKLEPNEDPKDTAIRELEEEGGIKAENAELMFVVYPTPGYTEEKIYIYRATGLTQTSARLDDGEFLKSEWFDKATLKKMIDSGEIKDGKTLIALLSQLK
ncbi:MAG: NUDIX hydrolase [Clostridia bacterium]|nr:NUDIX hydrolase [Clostridia bacterium]